GTPAGSSLTAADDAAVTVVVAGRDYPPTPDSGSPLVGIDAAEALGAVVFHAGTALRHGRLVTNGGRILDVTATGSTIADARARAYEAAEKIVFNGARYRSDIAVEAANGAPVG